MASDTVLGLGSLLSGLAQGYVQGGQEAFRRKQLKEQEIAKQREAEHKDLLNRQSNLLETLVRMSDKIDPQILLGYANKAFDEIKQGGTGFQTLSELPSVQARMQEEQLMSDLQGEALGLGVTQITPEIEQERQRKLQLRELSGLLKPSDIRQLMEAGVAPQVGGITGPTPETEQRIAAEKALEEQRQASGKASESLVPLREQQARESRAREKKLLSEIGKGRGTASSAKRKEKIKNLDDYVDSLKVELESLKDPRTRRFEDKERASQIRQQIQQANKITAVLKGVTKPKNADELVEWFMNGLISPEELRDVAKENGINVVNRIDELIAREKKQ